MLKKIVISLIGILLVACSKTSKINIEETGEKFINELGMTNIVTRINSEKIATSLYLDEALIEEGVFYISKSNTSDMVGIFKSSKPNDLKKGLDEYILNLTQQNSNYFPLEVDKLEKYILKEKDGYIYLVVSSNQAKAASLIDDVK